MKKSSWLIPALMGLLAWAGQTPVRAENVSLILAKADKAKSVKVSTKKVDAASNGSDLWISGYAGYDFAILGGLNEDIKSVVDYAENIGDDSETGTSNSGILAGLEMGLSLGGDSALSLNFENTWTAKAGLDITSGPDAGIHETFDSTLLGITLNYRLTIAKGTALTLGSGFYHGSTHFASNITSTDFEGDFGGGALGGILGVSHEIDLGGGLSLGLSARFRVVNVGKLTAKKFDVNGSPYSGDTYALLSGPSGSGYREINLAPTNVGALPSGYHWLDLDYTGFTGNVGLNIAL